MYDKGGNKSRVLFTSGLKNQPTRDTNTTNTNSPFGEALIEILSDNENTYELSLLNIFSFIYSKFKKNDLGSTPRYGTFRGDEGGQFFFCLKQDSKAIWEQTLKQNTIEDYDKFIQIFPKSLYTEQAKNKKNKLIIERKQWDDFLGESISSISKFKSEENSFMLKKQIEKALHELNQLKVNINTEAHDNNEWNKLMEINDDSRTSNTQRILALEEFIKNNKKSKYFSYASDILAKIQKDQKEIELWKEINKKQGSLKYIRRGFWEYINIYKHEGAYIAKAEERVQDISLYMEVREEIDKNENLPKGRELLDKYLQKYPNGFYHKKVERELNKISIETQSKQIRIDFKNAEEDNNIEKIYDLFNHIKGLQDKEIEANREVFVAVQDIISNYEQAKRNNYEQAINSNKICELRLFIEKYSDDALARDLVEKIETRLYEKDAKLFYEAEEEKTLELYLEYQGFFKQNGNFSTNVDKRIDELKYYELLETKESYKHYLREYQEGGLMLVEAEKRIHEIEFNERKQLAYETVIKENSLELCEQYLNEYDDIKDNQWIEIDALLKKLNNSLRASELFEEINNAREGTEKLGFCRSYINKYSDEGNIGTVKQISQEIQEKLNSSAALKDAIDTMNIEALENYKKKHAQNHEKANDHIEYLNAKKEKTKEAFDAYIRKYQEGGINQLRAEDGLKYIEALSINEIQAFHNYLDSSIENEFENEAREKIKELEELKEVEEAYKEALNTNTIEQYSNYIRLYGVKNEAYKDVVIKKLGALKKAKQDNAEFEIARDSNGTELLSNYIGKYGLEGLNGVEATRLLRERGLGITEKDLDLAEKVEGTTIAITSLVKHLKAKEERITKAKIKEDREAKAKAKEEKEAKEEEVKSRKNMSRVILLSMMTMIVLFVVIIIVLLSK